MRPWKLWPGAFALALMPYVAQAAEPIGAAVIVVNQVTADFEGDKRQLQNGNDVHQNELIEVSTDGSSELKLNDDTKMALGPGSKLLLDKFVYDGEKSKGNIAVNLVKGAFRFVTGVAAKPSYIVRVPQASITVRGTVFDVFVEDNGTSWLLLHEGAVRICNERGGCRDLDEPGKLIRVNDDGAVDPPSRWTKLKQKTNFNDAFPFVEKKPDNSPPVMTRDDILIDVVLPPKKKRKIDPPKDRADKDDYERPKKKKRVDKAEEPERKKPKRKVARRDDDDDNSKIMDGVGIAIGIGGGIGRGFGGGRGGGGRGGGNYGGGGRGR